MNITNGLYHVTSRGNGRARIFHADADRLRFLSQLADSLKSYKVKLCAYALMANHFHLLVRTPQANLSQFMQRLVTSYALYLRYKRKRPGHQFQGRFKAKLVEDEDYLTRVSRYIHLNPVRTESCKRLPADELRKRLNECPWSSYWEHVRARPRTNDPDQVWPAVAPDVLEVFSPDRASARRAYRRYVERGLERPDEQLRQMINDSAYAIGSDAFIEKARLELLGRRQGDARDRDVDLPRPRVDIARIDAAVAQAFGIDSSLLRSHGHRAPEAKKIAVELARRLTGWTQRRLGGHYGAITSQAVSQIARQWREDAYLAPLRKTLEKLEQGLVTQED
jgi:REP element-mobilizing transposase RayT